MLLIFLMKIKMKTYLLACYIVGHFFMMHLKAERLIRQPIVFLHLAMTVMIILPDFGKVVI
ncbi:hypothetical protein DJ022_15555 [Acinetobacter radioresistens]|nr:hypothetical protein [Acinetobacter radioresistens]MBA5701375.1 hypothetical protein [Acinetobacter radioresistens]